ncbi:prevent-host-death protein [Nocardia asteroides]|uniref:prevent-host-death protein n=1 Tax=Nocardia asteroides TaxID=1824 RepID=UPI001E6229D8|nr:prevent-host-death protein [Nocardia asteroides]UGT63311.1 prevent-host-death protein [Nocardia asteroides]
MHIAADPSSATRRDGEAEDCARLPAFAAQLITVALDDPGSLIEHMSNTFPWLLALSPTDRESCVRNLIDAARASFPTGRPHPAIAELTSWKETATAVAAGLGNTDLHWIDEDTPVRRP